MKVQKHSLPRVGMRIIKSAIGVFLCFVIYLMRGRQGTPFYSALAVLWCVQPQVTDSVKNALQRTIGTGIGALFGLLVIQLEIYGITLGDGVLHYLMISGSIIPIIYVTVLLKQKNASYFACVVYLSIVVNHIGDTNPFLFVADRSVDTMIGILVGLAINLTYIPGKIRKDSLYVVDLDQVLQEGNGVLTPYNRFLFLNMLGKDVKLTFRTLSTPATYLEKMMDICPTIPVIAMDGAILYDVRENSYPKVYVISPTQADELEKFILSQGFHLFCTVILEDVLIIYYDGFENKAEKEIYSTLHKSPYRNYLNKPRPKEHPVVYFMLVDETKKVEELHLKLQENGMIRHLKVLCYPSDDYPGYSYLKIYNQNASVDNMMEYLSEIALPL